MIMLREKRDRIVREGETELIDEMIDGLEEEKENKFGYSVFLKNIAKNVPESFDSDRQKKISRIVKEIEEPIIKSMVSKAVYNIALENPDCSNLVPAMEELSIVEEDKIEENPREELFNTYYGICSWIKSDQEIPKEIIEEVYENRDEYDQPTFNAMTRLMTQSIINKNSSNKVSFEKLNSLLEESREQRKIDQVALSFIECIDSGVIEKDESVKRKIRENYDRLSKSVQKTAEDCLQG